MRKHLTIGVVLLALVVASGCAQKYSAEQDGRKLGEAICDLRDASTEEEIAEAKADISEQVDDLASKYTMFTAEDRADIENNLADLAEHRVQGNTALMQQDLAVLQRSVDNIRDDVNEVDQAAWDGLSQGLSDCIG